MTSLRDSIPYQRSLVDHNCDHSWRHTWVGSSPCGSPVHTAPPTIVECSILFPRHNRLEWLSNDNGAARPHIRASACQLDNDHRDLCGVGLHFGAAPVQHSFTHAHVLGSLKRTRSDNGPLGSDQSKEAVLYPPGTNSGCRSSALQVTR
jgi:hypothetical protein